MLQYPKPLSIGQIAETIERTMTDVKQGKETESRQEKTEREGKENRLTEYSHPTSPTCMATMTMKRVQHSHVL